MKKNTLKKVVSALSLTAVAASAVSLSAFGAGVDYPGNGDNAKVKPVLSVSKLVVDKEMAGQDVQVTIDVSGGTDGAYVGTGIRLYYSDRLTLKKKATGLADVKDGVAIADLGVKDNKIDDSCTEPGFDAWFFTTGGTGNYGVDGTMWTITFTLPADAQEGEVFPLDIVYKPNPSGAKDCFIDYYDTDDGKLMEAYTFTKGIYCNTNPNFAANAADVAKCPKLADIDPTYDGYIAIAGPVETSTTTTTTVATTTTTTAATTTTTTAATTTTTAGTTTTTKPGTTTTTKPGTTTTTKPGTTTTTKPGTTTTGKKDSSPKTGVAGVGVAAAGLAVAIGTAFVLRKKED